MRSVLEELSANVEKLTYNNNDISKKLGRTLDKLRTVWNELKAANKKALKYEKLYNQSVRELYGSHPKMGQSADNNEI